LEVDLSGLEVDVSDFESEAGIAINFDAQGTDEMILCSLSEDLHSPAPAQSLAKRPSLGEPPPNPSGDLAKGTARLIAPRLPPAMHAAAPAPRPSMDIELGALPLPTAQATEARLPSIDLELGAPGAPLAPAEGPVPNMLPAGALPPLSFEPTTPPTTLGAEVAPGFALGQSDTEVIEQLIQDVLPATPATPATPPTRAPTAPLTHIPRRPIREKQSINARRAERFRVNLQVRYECAADFVREYAENLSNDGLFLGGAEGLEEGEELQLELDLPGFGQFPIRGVVVHLVDHPAARQTGKPPGAGIFMTHKPPDFAAALLEYLGRLGRRKDFLVYVHEGLESQPFQDAGFLIERAPDVDILSEALGLSETPVVGVVVPRNQQAAYETVARRRGYENLILTLDSDRRLDEIMGVLDGNIQKRCPP